MIDQPDLFGVLRVVPMRIDYTNHRGERSQRLVLPGRITFGATEFHPDPQWLVEAFDLDRRVRRTFAMRDIHAVELVEVVDLVEVLGKPPGGPGG